MRAALLNLARAERNHYGYVTDLTRERLRALGVSTRDMTRYFIMIGVA